MQAGARSGRACAELGIAVRTYERWSAAPALEDKRRGPHTEPANKLSDSERKQMIEVATSKEYCDLSPAKIVPSLADKGIYIASESSFYRVLKANKLDAHRSTSKPPRHSQPKALVATGPNQVWSWDITYLKSLVSGLFFYLYLVEDVFSRAIIAAEVHECESSEIASRMIERACLSQGIQREQLALHSDNGGPMKGATMLATLQRLGVVPSFSRPSVSNDNPFSESLFRTLKYVPSYPQKPFESIQDAQAWVDKFVHWYNYEHLHSAIRFVTPMQRHTGEDVTILKKRKRIYEAARRRNPNRWSRHTRNWNKNEVTILGRLTNQKEGDMKLAA